MTKRVMISLSDAQYAVLKGMKDYSGTPVSSFISELVGLSMPTFERMLETFSKVKRVTEERKKQLAKNLEEFQSEIEPVIDTILKQQDLFLSKLDNTLSDSLGDASAPISNRGATQKTRKPGKPRTARISSPLEREKFFPKIQSRKGAKK